MVGKTNYSSVPTAVDFENNANNGQKKYTVNRNPNGLVISRALCTLMAIGALLLAILVGLLVFFFVPRCTAGAESNAADGSQLVALSEDNQMYFKTNKDNYEDERLPRSIAPIQYRIQIVPFLENSTTSGSVIISLHVKETTDEIIFHVKDIKIDERTVKLKSPKKDDPIPISSQKYIDGERYKIILGETLETNVVYSLEMMFTGSLNQHLQGFYKSEYRDSKGVTRFLASTQFSPTDARRAFPCFDEPSFKANFTIFIGRPKNLTSISNMPLEKSDPDPNNNDLTWDYYKTTPKMSTYLVAFVVSDLQPYGSSDRLIKMWSRQSEISQTRYAAEFASKVLHHFENYFTIPFPLEKLDIVAIPNFGFNAMENWGLITFRETSLFYEDNQSDMENKRETATTLAHELAHQWFGNLVTPASWDDLWLKEGFASYFQYFGTNFAEPDWRIFEEFLFEVDKAFELDALQSARPISFASVSSKQIRQTFDALSYSKGAALIRMTSHFVTEPKFKAALINFLKKHEYNNANRNDFFEALDRFFTHSDFDIAQVLNTWVNQPGFPVLTAVNDRNSRKLILSQRRFSYTGETGNETWIIPISLLTSDQVNFEETKPKFWLKEATLTVDFTAPDWYLLNINQTGYFVVNYDEENWNALTENIMALPALIRAQLIGDSMNLARANLLDYHVPLRLIAKMAVKDADIMFVPTSVALKKLQYLSDILASTPSFGLFEEFQTTIFKNTYQKVDADRNYYGSNYLEQRIRRTVLDWACRKTDSECAIRSHHMYRGWMERNIMVPPVLRHVVYCTAIRQGTEAEWEFAYQKLLTTKSVSERNILLDALGCTTKKWLLSKYLDNMVKNDSSIRIQDADRVFKSVADNHAANSLAFDFLRSNWNKLLAHYGEGFNIISKMVKCLPRYMNNEYQLGELISFRNRNRDNLGTTSQAFDSAIEQVRGNVVWMKKNYESVEKWLRSHQFHYNLL